VLAIHSLKVSAVCVCRHWIDCYDQYKRSSLKTSRMTSPVDDVLRGGSENREGGVGHESKKKRERERERENER
jgi:hypothetical protein